MTPNKKPKLVFFQNKYDATLPEFLLIHKNEHVKCLSLFFDVTVINDDCDYDEVCQRLEPDLALFESGVGQATCRRPVVTNTQACANVPKLGLHNGDPFCSARSGFISDMDRWGIGTFFSISTTAAEHTPQIADRLFVWPNSVDPDVYRNYAGWKSIPVLFTGNKSSLYPWRQKILALVSERFPSLICPHPGWDPGTSGMAVLHGERYARTINASSIVPACGTVAREVVRKHFEIPACRACLVTERSPALIAAGYADMENCVFADEADVLDKIQYLFANPEVLERITDAGYQLAHTRHTMRQRDQIRQWYMLNRNLGPRQKIIQPTPFAELVVVEEGTLSPHLNGGGVHLESLREGDRLLWSGQHEAAERMYLRALNYIPWMPELRLRVALVKLHRGEAQVAREWIAKLLQFTLVQYKAVDPDPVEWAYYVVSLLCLGRLRDASKAAGEFAWLKHEELDRVRWAVAVLQHGTGGAPPGSVAGARASIHPLPDRSFADWLKEVRVILEACGQSGMAGALGNPGQAAVSPAGPLGVADGTSLRSDARSRDELDSAGALHRERRYSQVKSKIKQACAKTAHRLEAKCGYFLPYRMSAMRRDEFFREVHRLAKSEAVRTAVVVGAGSAAGATEALLAGTRENERRPSLYCVGGPTRAFRRLRRRYAGERGVTCVEIAAARREEFSIVADETIAAVRRASQLEDFDMVVVDGETLGHDLVSGPEIQRILHRARIVLLADLSAFGNHENCDRLLEDDRFRLHACNPGLRGGYAIFMRDSSKTDSPRDVREEAIHSMLR